MTQPITIIYLTGKPGVGKYTIAKELAANYGFKHVGDFVQSGACSGAGKSHHLLIKRL